MDYIFLLSADEVEELFDDEVEDYVDYEERGAVTTDYARVQGAWFLDEDGEDGNKGTWWLRYYGDFLEGVEGKYDYPAALLWTFIRPMNWNCCVISIF